MIERPVGFVALSLPFVAVLVEVVPHFPGGQVAIVVSAAVCYAIAAACLELPRAVSLFNAVPFVALLAVGALAWRNPTIIGPWGPEILVGALFGFPWLLVAYAARVQDPPGIRFVVFATAVVWGLLLIADPPAGALGVTGASTHFLSHFAGLAGEQVQVFGGLVPGATTPALPLHSVFDATYAALTAVAVGGLLLVTVRPQTGDRMPLPVAVRAFRESGTERELSSAYGFTPNQLEVFRERSSGESPLLTWPPGLEPIFYGAAVAGGFLVAAYFFSSWAVLGATVAVGAAVALLVRFTESPIALATARPPRSRRRAARARAPAPSPGDAPSDEAVPPGVAAPPPASGP